MVPQLVFWSLLLFLQPLPNKATRGIILQLAVSCCISGKMGMEPMSLYNLTGTTFYGHLSLSLSLCLISSNLQFAQSVPPVLASLLFLKYLRHIPVLEPLHLDTPSAWNSLHQVTAWPTLHLLRLFIRNLFSQCELSCIRFKYCMLPRIPQSILIPLFSILLFQLSIGLTNFKHII